MAAPDFPPLSKQICFDLYAASRAVNALYRPILDELGLTYPQYLVLIVLWERDDQSVKELGETLRLDHGTLTPLLRRMEDNGFVRRRRSVSDERVVRISLTPAGAALRDRAHDIQCEIKKGMGLTEDELNTFQATLRVVTRSASR